MSSNLEISMETLSIIKYITQKNPEMVRIWVMEIYTEPNEKYWSFRPACLQTDRDFLNEHLKINKSIRFDDKHV